ncbi:MAG: sialate O-acetylesterase, partial [bacterium]|nr:sialate O-acetylesterase [bacterium]
MAENRSTLPCPGADLWIMAGQSNMQGCGYLQHPIAPDPRVWSFGMDYQWGPARPPLHDIYCAADPVHRELMLGVGADAQALARRAARGRAGTDPMCGPGVFFARTLLKHLPADRSIALLPFGSGHQAHAAFGRG